MKKDAVSKNIKKINTFLSKFDKNYVYLIFVIVIILLVMIVHSSGVKNQTYSFGYCTYTIRCSGISLGNVCLGGKVKESTCINPANVTDEYHMIELECALQANALCKAPGVNNLDWVPDSNYENKTCQEWKDAYPQITLISCNQTFPDITQYSLLK